MPKAITIDIVTILIFWSRFAPRMTSFWLALPIEALTKLGPESLFIVCIYENKN